MKKILFLLLASLTLNYSAQTYCLPSGSTDQDVEIYNVMLNGARTHTFYSGNYSNYNLAPGPSSSLSIYSDFTTMGALTSITQGAVVSYSVAVDEGDGSYFQNSGIAIWIDFDQNGTLNDAGEQIYIENSTVTSPRTISGTFTVPVNATPGNTRMRVIAAVGYYGPYLYPCLSFVYGEAEDYLVTIVPNTPCSGTPAANSVASISATPCYSNPVGISLTSDYTTAVSYQWYVSNTSINGPFAAVPGGTMSTVTANINAPTWYRAVIGCGANTTTSSAGAILVLNTPLSGIYTINSLSATAGTNFQSFNALSKVLKCVGVAGPVTVNVVASTGPYNEQVDFTQVSGASAINSITINGNSNLLLFSNSTPGTRPSILELDGADYMTFNDLVVRGPGTLAMACYLKNGASFNNFNNCTFSCQVNGTGFNMKPVIVNSNYLSNCNNNTWTGCTMAGGYYGVSLEGQTYGPYGMANNFYNCTIRDFYIGGFYCNNARNCIIRNNIFERLNRTNFLGGNVITVADASANVLVEGNKIRKIFTNNTTTTDNAYVISVGGTPIPGSEIIIRNNIISDILSNGAISAINVSANNVFVYHNTISLDHAGSTTTATTKGVEITYYNSNVKVLDNVVSISRGGSGSKYCLYYDVTGGIFSDYNVLYNGSATNAYTGYLTATSYSTLAQWKAAVTTPLMDQHSFSSSPGFVNPAAFNYQPSNGVFDNSGFPLNVSLDVTGAARNLVTPDIGAYEFDGTICSGTPQGGTLSVTTTTTCPANSFSITVTGGSAGAGIVYTWQTATTSTGPWQNAANGGVMDYSGLQNSASLYYQRVTTCTGSALSATSTVENVTVTTIALAGVYSINSASATAGTNFQSFNDLASALMCGGVSGAVTVNVVSNSGPYNEQVNFGSIPGASAVNSVVINGNSNQLSFLGQVYPQSHVLKLSGADYMTFNNLEVSGTGTLSLACHLTNGSNNNTFNSCLFECLAAGTTSLQVPLCINGGNGYYNATSNINSSNNAFNTCTLTGGRHGVVIYGLPTANMVGNSINNCLIQDFLEDGVYNTYSTILLKGNTIQRPARTNEWNVTGVYLDYGSESSVADGNRIQKLQHGVPFTYQALTGMYINGTNSPGTPILIKNNMIGVMNSQGSMEGIHIQGNHILLYHNSISLESSSLGNTYGIYSQSTVGSVVKSNNIRISRAGFLMGLLYYYTGTTSDYNNVYVPGGAYGRQNITTYSTLASWQGQGYDVNGKNVDPNWVSTSTGNLAPTNQLLNNTGIPIGVTTDINSAARSLTTPDIGAYEFGLNACSLTAVMSPTFICAGSTVSITAGGASSYTWSFGGNSSTSTLAPASYTVISLTGSSGTCAATTKTFALGVNYVPINISGSANAVCNGQPVTLTASGAATYTWSGGVTDGVPFVPALTATYTVSGGDGSGCTNSAAYVVTVNPIPSVAVNSGSVCAGNSFVLVPTGAATYTFSSGIATVTPASLSNYTVTGTSSAGCVNSTGAVATVSVVALPVISANSGTICSGQSFTIVPSGAVTYTYSGGSAVKIPASSTSYTVTGSNAEGCVAAAPAISSVTVYTTPTVAVNSGTICSGSIFTINASGADAFVFSSGSATVMPAINTNYTVSGTNTTGCSSSAVSNVTVFALPLITLNNGTLCAGSSFTLNPSGAASYTFSSGSAVVSPASNASYSVTGTSTAGCVSSNTATALITVYSIPTVGVNSGSVCSGNVFTMVPSGAFTYTFSNGSSTVVPAGNASYSVTGTNTNGCVSANTAVASVTVQVSPTVAVNSGSICAGSVFTMVATGASTYVFSNGSSTVNPLLSNSYSVTGTGTNGCLSVNSAVSSVTVHQLPVISVNSGSICVGGTFTMNPSGAASYLFSNGTATASPASNTSYSVTGTSSVGCASSNTAVASVVVNTVPVVSVNSGTVCMGGTFTILATGASTYNYSNGASTVIPAGNASYSVTGISVQGCASSNTAISTVTVLALPVVTVNSGTICSGGVFTMQPSGAFSYLFSNGSATVSPLTNTSYSVTGTSTAGCTSTVPAVSSVTVYALPVISVNSGTVCAGQVFSMTPSGASSYVFSSGASTVIPVGNASYSVAGTSTAGCLSATPAIASVTVYALPVVSVNSGSVCAGGIFTMTPTGALSYSYSNGSSTVIPSANGNYTVTGISADGCISATGAVASVTVAQLPLLTINSGTSCAGQVYTFSPSGASVYVYSTGSGTVAPLVNTSYTVTGTDQAGCSNSIVATVSVMPLPVITVNSGTLCAGQLFTFIPSGATSYTYQGGSATVTPLSNTSYTVTGSDLNGCISLPVVSSLTVQALPSLTVTSTSATLCVGESATLTAVGAASYSWAGGNATSTLEINPALTITFTISGTDGLGCSSVYSFTQVVDECLGMKEGTNSFITIFPNPNTGRFVVITNEHCSYRITDGLGRCLYTGSLEQGANYLDMKETSKGLYFIRIEQGKNIRTSRVIVD